LTYKALAGIKVIKIIEDWTSNKLVESVNNEEQEGHKNCLCVKLANRNIAYRALGYISEVGVTVNTFKTFLAAMMTRETRKRLPVIDR